MRKAVTIVFNYRSPFCALIVDRLFSLDRYYDIDVKWVIAASVPRPSSLPVTKENPRFQYNRQDCERRARWLGLSWRPPAWRLDGVEDASFVGLYLMNTGSPYFPLYTEHVSRAYWCEGRNTSDRDVVSHLALEAGISEETLSSVAQERASLKRMLDANQIWCEQQSVLGVPYFMVDDQRFWGSDRLVALGRYLADVGCGSFNVEPFKNLF